MFIQDKNSPSFLNYNFKNYLKENFVVFLDCNYFDGIRIISFESKFSYKNCDFFHFNSKNKLESHLVFETRGFIKSKISLSDKTNIDLNQGICWVNINLYQKLRHLLYINNGDLENEIQKRVPFLLDIFNKKIFK